MLSEIKKKIIEVRLGKNDKEFAEFNTDRNKKRQEYEKRKKIMETIKKMIKKSPVVNLFKIICKFFISFNISNEI